MLLDAKSYTTENLTSRLVTYYLDILPCLGTELRYQGNGELEDVRKGRQKSSHNLGLASMIKHDHVQILSHTAGCDGATYKLTTGNCSEWPNFWTLNEYFILLSLQTQLHFKDAKVANLVEFDTEQIQS